MATRKKSVLAEAVAEETIDLDEVQRRHPRTITDEELRLMVRVERRDRAAWHGKQREKGREE